MSVYTIVEGRNVQDLISNVNRKMASGWKPIGAPQLGDGWYVQAMVYEEQHRNDDA